MITEPSSRSGGLEPAPVTYRGPAIVEVADGEPTRVDVELHGGRTRWSVGGRIAEGPRWWRGELRWGQAPTELAPGTQVVVRLDGREALAVVEARTPGGPVPVRGIQPPPFQVP